MLTITENLSSSAVIIDCNKRAATKNRSVFDAFVYDLYKDLVSYDRKLEKFANEFQENPLYAFEYSQEHFQNAARHKLAAEVLFEITTKRHTDDELKEVLLKIVDKFDRNITLAAQYPSFSTSTTSNTVKLYLNAARVEMVEIINSFILAVISRSS